MTLLQPLYHGQTLKIHEGYDLDINRQTLQTQLDHCILYCDVSCNQIFQQNWISVKRFDNQNKTTAIMCVQFTYLRKHASLLRYIVCNFDSSFLLIID